MKIKSETLPDTTAARHSVEPTPEEPMILESINTASVYLLDNPGTGICLYDKTRPYIVGKRLDIVQWDTAGHWRPYCGRIVLDITP